MVWVQSRTLRTVGALGTSVQVVGGGEGGRGLKCSSPQFLVCSILKMHFTKTSSVVTVSPLQQLMPSFRFSSLNC